MFLEVSNSYGIIPSGLKIKNTAWIGNVSKNFVTSWNLELTKAEVQLMEILILEHVRKLYAIEENFDSLFKYHTVQEDWLFRTRNHLEKFEKSELWRKLKSSVNFQIMKLCILNVWKVFKATLNFFSFKFNFLEFCNNFVPDLENVCYLLHLNNSDSNKESSSENSESKQDCPTNSCKNACLEIGNGTSKVRNNGHIEREGNANGNQAVLLENRLKGNFVSKNVVNLSKRNLNDVEISLLSEGCNFVPTCNNIDKAKLKMELEAFGRMLRLKWHFRNENKDINRYMFKTMSKFNLRNKDAATELSLSSLEEKLMKVEVPKDKFNNLTNSERKALYDLKNDKSIANKCADKGSGAGVWDTEGNMKEAEKQLDDE